MSKQLSILNSIPVVEWSCAGGECEYILAENTQENRDKLKAIGATDEEIEEFADILSETIDISYFGFDTCNASYWHKDSGFRKFEQPIEVDQ